jgi:phosphohistidine phosphatase
MNLYFLRHAKAGPHRNKIWKPDSKRPLTAEGEKQACKVAEGILAMELEFDLILTSPYARAFRTAELAAETLKNDKLVTTENLVSEGSPEKLIAEINEKYSSVENILLVGHEPYMTRVMSTLLTGNGALRIDFKKAGLAKLSIEGQLEFAKCACLHWILTPRQVSQFRK